MPAPAKVRVRGYNVGFGDCFLLTVGYDDQSERHVLIDFGSTRLPRRGGPGSLVAVAEQIRADCGGKLHVVVATHRHADHIAGFGGEAGEIVAALDPDLVVQPWTEEPDLATDATAPARPVGGGGAGRTGGTGGRRAGNGRGDLRARAAARLGDMHALARHVQGEATALAADRRAPRTVTDQLAFLGEANLPNKAAVTGLQRLGGRHVYAHFGTDLKIGSILPGVGVEVLGPPTPEQYEDVAEQARADPTEFWHLAAAAARTRRTAATRLFPNAAVAAQVPQEARWVIPQIDRMHAEEMLALVRILDEAMNNTSLILLFDVGGKLLLFPGDAQIESWRYALRDAEDAVRLRARVGGAHVYKVGHHGSLNATPKRLLWEAMTRKGDDAGDERLVTLLSTLPGVHGADARRTEVPRKTLLTELDERSRLVRTDKDTTATTFWRDIALDV